jgi:hypothetical protein
MRPALAHRGLERVGDALCRRVREEHEDERLQPAPEEGDGDRER